MGVEAKQNYLSECKCSASPFPPPLTVQHGRGLLFLAPSFTPQERTGKGIYNKPRKTNTQYNERGPKHTPSTVDIVYHLQFSLHLFSVVPEALI